MYGKVVVKPNFSAKKALCTRLAFCGFSLIVNIFKCGEFNSDLDEKVKTKLISVPQIRSHQTITVA